MAKIQEIEIKSKSWLEKQVKGERFVFKKSEINKSILAYLQDQQLMAELNNQYVFIKSESELTVDAFKNNLWLLVLQFLNLAFDGKWYPTGFYAFQLAVENFSIRENQITVSTHKKSNTIIELPGGFKIIASYDKDFEKKPLNKKKIFSVEFEELKHEYLVINSTEQEYKTYKNEIISIIKNRHRDNEFILDYFKANSQPVLLARLIGALRELEDFALRIELEKLLKISGVKISIKNPFGPVVLTQSFERPAYLNRFELFMQKAIDFLEDFEKPKRLGKKFSVKDLDKVVVNDTYHSLTIEGYTVTRALLEYLKNEKTKEQDFDVDLKNRLAAKGFMNALAYIRNLMKIKHSINEQISYKLFQELWKPSINAGLMKSQFDVYRKHMVAIKGAQYVPPSHEKVPYLVDEVFDYAKNIHDGFALGIFLHFFYVGVHPHSDGNGRISRFLMNLAFVNDGYQWLTIPSDDRKKYFQSLERSQLEEDIKYFAEYVSEKYREIES